MFNFFKKQKPETNFGWFTTYGMEDVYYFLTEKRIQKKIDELKDKPTLGTRFEDFVTEKNYISPSGEIHFFIMLLSYFQKDLDLAVYLYNISKNFSENNYPVKNILKEDWNRHLESMDRLLLKRPENIDQINSWKKPVYWIEYDLFYVEILKNLIYNFNLQKFSNLIFVGEFNRIGSKIITPNAEIFFVSKAKSKKGLNLTFKSEILITELKLDSRETNLGIYEFDTFFGSYQLEIIENKVIFIEKSKIKNKNIEEVLSTNFLILMEEMVFNYLENFEKITDRYRNSHKKPEFNFFLMKALQVKELNSDLKKNILDKLLNSEEFWGKLDRYSLSI